MFALLLLGLSGALLSGCRHVNLEPGQESETQSLIFTSMDSHAYSTSDPALSAHLRAINDYRPTSHAQVQQKQKTASTTETQSKSKAYPADNQRLSNEILAALISQDDLKHAHIRVSGYYGNMLIFGEVPNEQAVQLAQNIASSFNKVKTVHTALRVGSNLSRAQRTEDSINNTEVKAEIAKLDIPHAHLQVATNANQVFIVGPLSQNDRTQLQHQLERLPFIDAVYFY